MKSLYCSTPMNSDGMNPSTIKQGEKFNIIIMKANRSGYVLQKCTWDVKIKGERGG